MAISVLSPAERDFVVTGLAQTPPSRLDGRDLLTPRPISISYAEAPQASGSSRVLIGGTQVVAGIRLEVGDVDPSAPKGKEGWRGKVEVDVYVQSHVAFHADDQNTSGLPSDELFALVNPIYTIGECHSRALHAFCTRHTYPSAHKVSLESGQTQSANRQILYSQSPPNSPIQFRIAPHRTCISCPCGIHGPSNTIYETYRMGRERDNFLRRDEG